MSDFWFGFAMGGLTAFAIVAVLVITLGALSARDHRRRVEREIEALWR